jgi:hypothetical protein
MVDHIGIWSFFCVLEFDFDMNWNYFHVKKCVRLHTTSRLSKGCTRTDCILVYQDPVARNRHQLQKIWGCEEAKHRWRKHSPVLEGRAHNPLVVFFVVGVDSLQRCLEK